MDVQLRKLKLNTENPIKTVRSRNESCPCCIDKRCRSGKVARQQRHCVHCDFSLSKEFKCFSARMKSVVVRKGITEVAVKNTIHKFKRFYVLCSVVRALSGHYLLGSLVDA